MPDTAVANTDTTDVTEGEPDTTDTATDTAAGADEGEANHQERDAETFPRAYVEKLRQENGKYRDRAKQADTYAQRLHTELVRATGRLADPTDLEYAAEHLDDGESLTQAIDELLAAKPHLGSRRPSGDIGQGQRGSTSEPFSLLDLLKERT